MRRHLPRLLLTGALLSPVTVYALGLGEIRLSSALNQPFDAEIELISATRDELASLKVGLADPDLFARYGIDRPAFLAAFDFSIAPTSGGGAAIKVTSNRSVTEPFVTLLVEASWARGRLLREYTVLLDPPLFMPTPPQAAAPVATPQSGAQSDGRIERQQAQQPEQPPAPAPVTPPEPAQTSSSAPATQSQDPVHRLAGEYAVQRNDTLWRIASDVNPGSPSVVNRTMIALFRANPEAFSGNINRLRAGSVLRIPALSEIDAISGGEASAEVARQAAEWSAAASSGAAEEAGRLRLVTPQETPATTAEAAVAALEEPGVAPEAQAAGSGAPAAQDGRLELDSPGLASVQQAVDDTPAQGEAPDAAQGEIQGDASAATQAPQTEEPARPVAPAPMAAQESTSPSLFERIGQYWWVPIALGVLVVLALVLAFIRRRREESDMSLASLEPLEVEPLEREPVAPPPPVREFPAAAPTVVRGRDRAESFLVEDQVDLGQDMPQSAGHDSDMLLSTALDAEETPGPAPRSADETLSSETAVRFDQQDALAEADFHMAYGLYDQAADLVKIAIEREPARRELKHKLLEIYFVWGNKDQFLETAHDLYANRGEAAPGEWDKVLIMGRQIAVDDPMFKGEAGATRVDLVDVNLEGGENRVDVDLFAEPDEATQGEIAADGLDLEFTSGEYPSATQGLASVQGASQGTFQSASELDFLLDESPGDASDDPTREIDPLARTQETPTVESPLIGSTAESLPDAATVESPLIGSEAAALDEDARELSLKETTLGGTVFDVQTPLFDSDAGDSGLERTMLAPSAFAANSPGASDEIDRGSQTIREQTLDPILEARNGIDQTAELSIDDLGLDLDALEPSSLEDTGALERDILDTALALGETQESPSLSDDELTQLAPSLGSFDRTMEAPRVEQFDSESSGTIYVDQTILTNGAGDTVEQPRPDVDATASMKVPTELADLSEGFDLDLDLGSLPDPVAGGDTIEQPRLLDSVDEFSSDVFAEHTLDVSSIDLDVGDPLSADDNEPTNKQNTAILELSELDPVTMSEVGTKLDLARAYMDMGDPDGARSILDEVLEEGNPGQQQEAQRLLDSIR